MLPFENLHQSIRHKLVDKGIVTPTHAQEEAIPEILKGSHVLLIAPTGIGKTEAAVLPIFHRYLEFRDDYCKEGGEVNPPGITILYVTPLRALNRDMLKRMREWGEVLDMNVAVRHGDTTPYERTRQSNNPPDFLITTPETLQIMLTGRKLREHLGNVKWVIVDEIHEMATDERGAQLGVALERIVERSGEFQRIGLSATIGEPEKVGGFLAGINREISIVKIQSLNRKEIMVERPEVTEEDQQQSEEMQAWPELIAALKRASDFMESHSSTLFFVNTRDTAEIISSRMKLLSPDLPVGIHHGSLSKDIRIEMEEEFKNGIRKGLICTSSMELGIDIGITDLVIQYNSPRQVERFLQRLGRAGHRTHLISKGIILAVGPDEIAESMVIGRKAFSEELESVEIRDSPMDVCANQLVAMTMEYKRMEIHHAYEILRRSYSFRNLNLESFLEVVRELSMARVIWSDEVHFGRGRNSIDYFYNNISMIPDQKTYFIRDITTRKIVGTLDEAFAITLGARGTFIIKGNNWNFVEMEDNEVLVEPAPNLGILPDWVGEDIPVPYTVAQEVGNLRGIIANSLVQADTLQEDYPVGTEAIELLQEYVNRQIAKGIPVPTDRLVTVEFGGKMLIINACFGSKVNETLGQLITGLLSARLGTAVRFTTDPYRVIMESSRRIDPEEVVEFFQTFPPASLQSILQKLLKNSSYLKWHFFHVARKFGIISIDADLNHINLDAYMDRFRDTLMYQEAIDKVLWDKMDVRGTQNVLQDIQQGNITLRVTAISPIGYEGLENRRELMNPDRASHTILQALKIRIERNTCVLICMNCGSATRHRIKDISERITCSRCGGNMLAAVSGYDRTLRFLVEKKMKKKGKLNSEERKELRELMTNASLVREYGKRAVIALSARGVGPKVAGRILSKLHRDEYDMYREILKAEVTFARTRRFWS